MTDGPHPSDNECLAGVRAGDEKAFSTLVQRYQGIVYRYLFHFMGNAQEAEDMTQEAFLMLFRKVHLHDPHQAFQSWLITMARNLAISHHRKKTPISLSPEIINIAIRDISPGPEGASELKETTAELHLAIQKLSEELRDVVIFRYLLGIPLQDVAKLLEIPEGTAKSRLFKARQDLRDLMGRVNPVPLSSAPAKDVGTAA